MGGISWDPNGGGVSICFSSEPANPFSIMGLMIQAGSLPLIVAVQRTSSLHAACNR